MITIIDYGIGNLRSVEKAFQAVGADVVRSDRFADIERAEKIVLPGVGAFGACINELRRRDLEKPILDAVRSGKPLLGVCVGMQMLFEVGEEMGSHRGLGILPGRVVRFQFEPAVAAIDQVSDEPEDHVLKVPHMGWNAVVPLREHPLLEGIRAGSYFYFVHSYFADPKLQSDVLGQCTYGREFAAIVHRNNVFGVQFHPEKSQRNGLKVLSNFAKL